MAFLAGEDLTSKRLTEETGAGVRKFVDQTVTSSTTLVNDTALTWTVEANTNYLFEFYLAYTGATTGDIKIGLGVPAGATAAWHAAGLDGSLAYKNAANMSEASVPDFGCVSTSLGRLIQAAGYLAVDSTAGTFVLKFAQQASSATATTMRSGSFGILYRV